VSSSNQPNTSRQVAGVVHRVLPGGPLVAGEDHRTVLDADLDPPVPGVPDQRGEGLAARLQVLGLGMGLVRAEEGVHHTHPQQRGCVDDLALMGGHLLPDARVRIERSGNSRAH
jgi:hypothetical protein